MRASRDVDRLACRQGAQLDAWPAAACPRLRRARRPQAEGAARGRRLNLRRAVYAGDPVGSVGLEAFTRGLSALDCATRHRPSGAGRVALGAWQRLRLRRSACGAAEHAAASPRTLRPVVDGDRLAAVNGGSALSPADDVGVHAGMVGGSGTALGLSRHEHLRSTCSRACSSTTSPRVSSRRARPG